jgi:hypothetical protein
MNMNFALFIPIVSIIMGIGIGMLALVLNFKRRKDLFALYHQERMAAIDKGVELPPLPESLLSDDATPYNPRRHLLKGLRWVFVGLALGVALYATVEERWFLFALIPVGAGLAHLIYYAVEGRQESRNEEASATQSARRTIQ